jgi:hypothetical protein
VAEEEPICSGVERVVDWSDAPGGVIDMHGAGVEQAVYAALELFVLEV